MTLESFLLEILACPEDKGPLYYLEDEKTLYNPRLTRRYRIENDIPVLLIDEVDRGERDASEVPRDVLATLLRNADDLDLPSATLLREVAYFPWVGSHSTSMQLVHAMHHVFEWIDGRPDERARLIDEDRRLQMFVHESLRLHPASPVALRVCEEPTTLGGIDLYADPLGALARLDVVDPVAGHAFRFWQRVGYTVVGVIPDAEGVGAPSIHLAKSLKPGSR